ncbi:MAG: hypothetical protein LBM70_10420 [Victivallales bacterium]|nr:hypothetical protein [Victivallales bacterium]
MKKFLAKRKIIAAGFGIALCGMIPAIGGAEFKYSGTDDEIALLNDIYLFRYIGNELKFALAYDQLPEGAKFSVDLLSKASAGKRINLLASFPQSDITGIEFLCRGVEGKGQLIIGMGDRATYNQKAMNIENGGAWQRIEFSDGKTRNLGHITWALVSSASPFRVQLANVKLLLADGKKLELYDPSRTLICFDTNGIPTPEGKSPSMDGRAILGMGGGYASMENTMLTIAEIRNLFDNIAIAPDFDFKSIAPLRNDYLALDVPMSYQTTESQEIGGFLGRHKAFGALANGFSRNTVLDRGKWSMPVFYHSGDYGHPAMLEANCRIIDALAKAGINDYIIPDSGWWMNVSTGFSPADLKAFREALNGSDSGIDWTNFDGKKSKIHFLDYFQERFGVRLTPQLLGLKNFNEFVPADKRGGDSPEEIRRVATFFALKRYVLLRFFSSLGAYGKSKGVNVVAMPLNCSSFGQGMARLDAYQADHFDLADTNVFFSPETPAIGRPGEIPAEAGLFGILVRGRTYREFKKLNGTKLRLFHEAGQAGANIPYRDPRLDYVLYYAATAATGADSLQSDFLSSYTRRGLPKWSDFSDPTKLFHHSRFVSQAASVAGFLDAYAVKPQLPDNQGFIVSLPRSADFFAVKDDSTMGEIARRELGYPVEFAAAEILNTPASNGTRIVLDDMRGHTSKQVKAVSEFLKNGSDRIVVLTPLALGHSFDGSDLLPAYTGEYYGINDAGAYAEFGVKSIEKKTEEKPGIIRKSDSEFSFPAAVKINGAVYNVKGEGFETVAEWKNMPLIQRKKLSNGNCLYLLGYQPGHKDDFALDRAVLAGIIGSSGAKPVWSNSNRDVLVHPFKITLPESESAMVYAIFDTRPYRNFVFQNGVPSWKNFMKYETKLSDIVVDIPTGDANGQIIYELISGESRNADSSDLKFTLDGKSARLYFVLPNTPAGQKFLTGLKKRHEFLTGYATPDLIEFLNDNKEERKP